MARFKTLLIIPALLIVLAMTGCSDKQIRQASIVLRDFGVGLEQVQEGFVRAYDAGYIDGEDYKLIQGVIYDIAAAGSEAVIAMQVAKSKPSAIVAIDKALEATDRLLNEGVLRVKNDTMKQALSATILALRTTLATAKALLQ